MRRSKMEYMTPEQIVNSFNNVEWDSQGNQLYSYDQMIEAIRIALEQVINQTQ